MLDKLRTSVSVRVSTILVLALTLMMAALCGFFIRDAASTLEQGILARGKSKAETGAAAVTELFEQALRSGTLTRDQVFGEQYAPLADGEVKKFLAPYDAFADESFELVGKSMLREPDILFAGAFDRNGYVATHTNPQRSKRKFDDKVGLAAARNERSEGLVQLYHRDTGEWAWDVSSPILVDGRHWGTYRIGISKAKLDAAIRERVLTMTTVSLLMIGLLCAMIFMLLRRALKPLDRIEAALGAVARGDLSQNVEVSGEDEIGRMGASYQTMIVALRRIIDQVLGSSSIVSASTEQISAGTEELAATARSQAASAEHASDIMRTMAMSIKRVANHARELAGNVDVTSASVEQMIASVTQVASTCDTLAGEVNEISASIEQMAASIRHVSQNLEQAAEVAGNTSFVAIQGKEAVDKTIASMGRIDGAMGEVAAVIQSLGQRSDEIGTIVEVIDDIAEQTNLLALNAAIEAARAGEHGRGFAVVADEVRKLAERSAKATGEITQLIKGIQQESGKAIASTRQSSEAIKEGTGLAQSAGRALEETVGSFKQVALLMGQISEATQEQNQGAEQITKAVESMSALTREVSVATREQAKGSQQISQAMVSMNAMTREVSVATEQEIHEEESVLGVVQNITKTTQESATATQLIAVSAVDLERQARELTEAVSFFKADTIGSTEKRLPAASAPALPAAR